MKKESIKAIIFDYDGLLIDTEDCWFRACQAVGRKYGVPIDEEQRLDLMRSHLSQYLLDTFKLPDSYDNVRKTLYDAFESFAQDAPLLPGAKQAIRTLSLHFRLAIGTGSITEQPERNMKKFGLHHYFECIIGQDKVTRPKPAPDIFLCVADKLGLTPESCVVIEDLPRGIAAAKAAGMKCIAVPNKYVLDADYSEADAVLSSLDYLLVSTIYKIAR